MPRGCGQVCGVLALHLEAYATARNSNPSLEGLLLPTDRLVRSLIELWGEGWDEGWATRKIIFDIGLYLPLCDQISSVD
jgi:hypothetical protein